MFYHLPFMRTLSLVGVNSTGAPDLLEAVGQSPPLQGIFGTGRHGDGCSYPFGFSPFKNIRHLFVEVWKSKMAVSVNHGFR